MRSVGCVLLMVAALLGPVSPAAAATALPGKKANYVVSFGSLRETSGSNWVRLGTYKFTSTGRVRSDTWAWSQSKPAPRVGTGTVPGGKCAGTQDTARPCEIKTAGGFLSRASEVRAGSFSLHTTAGRQYVNITWDQTTWRTEEWWVDTAPDGTYSRLTFKYSRKITHGYGYGSNAGFEVRRPMESVRAHDEPLTMTYHRAAKGDVGYVDRTWDMSQYIQCTDTTWCMAFKTRETGNCSCPAPYDKDRSLQNFVQQITGKDRRDTHWHWCTCLAKGGQCHKGNSHVYPLLQVIDDKGRWRGWVGVEASFYPYTDVADPRRHDMLSVFRVAEWT
ncbi:hypothetical protein [Nonomuraea sp. SBT364]|uniref:hypothetical protein n=1 Tax=Nonomuraea sp. SBT364 TaxID=1580530 RepID=UPI00066A566B|nr:hypothetical protein [Nonomuraea sp. SBT364]